MNATELDYYKQGFLNGNRSTDESLDLIARENAKYQQTMEIQNSNFINAEGFGIKALNTSTQKIMTNLNKFIPIQGIQSQLLNSETYEQGITSLDNITKGAQYNLTKNGTVAQMVSNSISTFSLTKVGEGEISGKIFAELALVSNQTQLDLELFENEYLTLNNIQAPRTGSAKNELENKILADENFSVTIGSVTYDIEDYKNMLERKKDFTQLNLWNNSIVKNSVEDLNDLDKIYEAHGDYSQKLIAEMTNKGFDNGLVNDFEDYQLSKLIGEGSTSDKIDEIFNLNLNDNLLIDDADDDPNNNLLNLSDEINKDEDAINIGTVGTDTDWKKLETAFADQEKAKLELKTSKDAITAGLHKYVGNSGFGAGTGFKWGDQDKYDSGDGVSNSLNYSKYVPTPTEIDRITENFIKKQMRTLNPKINNTAWEYIPVVGLLAQYFPQGIKKAVKNKSKVEAAFAKYNLWVKEINKINELKGYAAAANIMSLSSISMLRMY